MNAKQSTTLHAMNFTACNGLYVISPDATADSIHNQITARLTQLNVLLSSSIGESGFANRVGMTDQMKDEYLWTCSTIVEEVRELVSLSWRFGALAE